MDAVRSTRPIRPPSVFFWLSPLNLLPCTDDFKTPFKLLKEGALRTQEQLFTLNNVVLNALTRTNQIALDGVTKMIELQAETSRQLLEQSVALARQLGGCTDAHQINSMMTKLAQPSLSESLRVSTNALNIMRVTGNGMLQACTALMQPPKDTTAEATRVERTRTGER